MKDINQEEVYLDWDPSAYPLLEKIQSSVEKYMTLWHTGKGHQLFNHHFWTFDSANLRLPSGFHSFVYSKASVVKMLRGKNNVLVTLPSGKQPWTFTKSTKGGILDPSSD